MLRSCEPDKNIKVHSKTLNELKTDLNDQLSFPKVNVEGGIFYLKIFVSPPEDNISASLLL